MGIYADIVTCVGITTATAIKLRQLIVKCKMNKNMKIVIKKKLTFFLSSGGGIGIFRSAVAIAAKHKVQIANK